MAAFTLYGLPMWSIGAVPQAQSIEAGGAQPLEVGSAAAPLAIPTTTTGTDPVTGLAIEAFDATTRRSRRSRRRGRRTRTCAATPASR